MRWLELMCIEDIIIEIITELTKQETSVSVTGGKGYAAGKVYPSSPVGVLTLLGSEDNFTLVANKPGALEYVKYDRNNNNELIIMKWYRGASNIMIGSRDKLERFKIESLIE